MKKEYTLTEVSKLLQVPQHRLIYLCEAKVIIPDKSDAKGRGSSRRFSERNLLEFWVALTLSEFHVPAYYSTKILTTLRSFAKEVGKLVPTFQFPSSLTDANLPQINLLITNGTRLFFVLNLPNARPIVLGGVDLNKQTQKMQLVNIEIAFEGNENRINLEQLIHQISGSNAFFTLNLTQTARDLQTMLLNSQT